jgi:hypothetical protein
LEEKRRTVTEEIAEALYIKTTKSSVNEILPGIDPSYADRIRRLNDGIGMLVGQARDLNYGNQAMAKTAIDWLKSTQSFLINTFQPDEGYTPPGTAVPARDKIAISEVEHKA